MHFSVHFALCVIRENTRRIVSYKYLSHTIRLHPIYNLSQPYRTSPLIQPTAYEKLDLGPGSSQHLKMQADYLTGAKEAIPFADSRASEFCMKQKV